MSAGDRPDADEAAPTAEPSGVAEDLLDAVAVAAADVVSLRLRHRDAEDRAVRCRDDAIRAALGAGLSLRAIAARAGVGHSHVARIRARETSGRKRPT